MRGRGAVQEEIIEKTRESRREYRQRRQDEVLKQESGIAQDKGERRIEG